MVPFPPFLSALSFALLTVTREAKKQRWEKEREIGGDIEGERERERLKEGVVRR